MMVAVGHLRRSDVVIVRPGVELRVHETRTRQGHPEAQALRLFPTNASIRETSEVMRDFRPVDAANEAIAHRWVAFPKSKIVEVAPRAPRIVLSDNFDF